MKTYLYIIIIFFLTVALTVYFFIDPETNEIDAIITPEMNWTEKEREIISRLLSVPIMLYHNIDGKVTFSIELEVLRSHFQLLKDNNIKVIPLSELVRRLNDPEPFNEKVVVITFDDGYFSNYSKLLPLIKEFGYPITLFIYTDAIYTRAKRSMTWKRLQELEENGVVTECHSISHIDLDELSNEMTIEAKKKLFEEIYLSKRILELYLDKKINYFAFPLGRYNLNTVEMCRNAGYERVFSTDYGSNIITRNNYCLRRGHIKRDFSLQFIKQKVR